jgi:hypothetical protein
MLQFEISVQLCGLKGSYQSYDFPEILAAKLSLFAVKIIMNKLLTK